MSTMKKSYKGKSLANLLHAFSAWIAIATVGIVPLVIAPGIVNPIEQIKALLLVCLSTVAFLAWVCAMMVERNIVLRGGVLANIAPLGILAATGVSSLFSLSGGMSWFGNEGQEYTSFAVVLALTALYYVVINVQSERVVRRMSAVLIGTFLLSGAASVFSVFGLYVIPADFAKSVGFNPIGLFQSFTICLVATLALGWGFILPQTGRERLGRVGQGAVWLLTLITTLALLLADNTVAWILTAVAMVVLMAFFFINSTRITSYRWLTFPAICFVLSMVFMFARVPVTTLLPVTVSPSHATSFGIAKDLFTSQLPRLAVGSGPGTFVLDFARFKTQDISKTQFFGVRFDRASSHMITILVTTGVLGFSAWLFFLLFVGWSAIRALTTSSEFVDRWINRFALFTSWTVLLLAHVLDSSNVTMTFLLFILSGLLVRESVARSRESSVVESPRVMVGVAGGFGVTAVAMVIVAVGVFRGYSANIAFAQAIVAQNQGKTPAEIEALLVKAVNKNEGNPEYLRNLASVRLSEAAILVGSKEKLNADQLNQLKNFVSGALAAADAAVAISPSDPMNWSIRSMVYRELLPLVQGADRVARDSSDRAISLEPLNPANLVDRARVEIAIADQAKTLSGEKELTEDLRAKAKSLAESALVGAENVLLRAAELKPDYAPAYYYLAAVYERNGRVGEAVSRLETAIKYAPNDLGLGFQLGVMYLKQDKTDQAQVIFERIVDRYPSYSNALWYLAAIYANQDKKMEALELLNKVAELNPNNDAVKNAISELSNGGVSDAVPAPVEEGNEGAIAPSMQASP